MSITPQYLAGFFDGEGYVGIISWKGCESYTLKIQLTNTHLETLQRIQEEYGGLINSHDRMKTNINHSNAYVLCWYADKARNILQQIYPYSVTKKQRIECALQFPLNVKHREYRSPEKILEQRRVFERLRILNHQKVGIPEQYHNLAMKEHSEHLRKKQSAVELKKTHPDWTMQKIADELKVSPTMAHRYLRDSGIDTKRDYWSRRPTNDG